MPVVDDTGNIIFDPTWGPNGSIVSASNPSQVATVATPGPSPAPSPVPTTTASTNTSVASLAAAGPTADQKSAQARLQLMFDQYGLSSLSGWLWDQITSGSSADTIMLNLTNQAAYKARFPGQPGRQSNGFAELTPDAYLSTEASYKQAMRSNGLTPPSDPTAYANLFAHDISASELDANLKIYHNVALNFSPTMRQHFEMYAGMNVTHDDVYNMFQGNRPDLVSQYATATGTPVANASDFATALPTGTSWATQAGLQYASDRATKDEQALFHPLTKDPIMGTAGMPTDMSKEEKASF